MNTIEFKLNTEQLSVVISALNKITGVVRTDKNDKYLQSICTEINKKLSAKAISKCDSKKDFKIPVKYHEGFILHQIMDTVREANGYGVYERNAALKIFNEIDRQL